MLNTYKKLYEAAKILLFVLPLLATFYVTLANTWGLGDTEQVVATITAVTTLLGLLVKFKLPFDGTAYVEESADLDEPDKFSLHLNGDPADLQNQKTVRLKVTPKRKAAA